MKAVITVVGRDTVGIIAKVSDVLFKHNVNVLDISQSVLQDYFAMLMLVDVTTCDIEFDQLAKMLEKAGNDFGLKIHIMHQDIFNSMHRI